MGLEGDTVLKHWRKERGKEDAHEAARRTIQPRLTSSGRPVYGDPIRVRHSLVKPLYAFVLRVQLEHPHDGGRDAIGSRMTTFDEARADDVSFPVGIAIVITLAHHRTAVLRYFGIRSNVGDTRQVPCDDEQRSIKVQRWNDLRGEARAEVRGLQRYRADDRAQLYSNRELELRRRQDFRKDHRPKQRRALSRRL